MRQASRFDSWRDGLTSRVLGFAHHTGIRLAEVGFLLLLLAGVWLAAAQIPQPKFAASRTIAAGLTFAISGLLLIVATHWGHFGQLLLLRRSGERALA